MRDLARLEALGTDHPADEEEVDAPLDQDREIDVVPITVERAVDLGTSASRKNFSRGRYLKDR